MFGNEGGYGLQCGQEERYKTVCLGLVKLGVVVVNKSKSLTACVKWSALTAVVFLRAVAALGWLQAGLEARLALPRDSALLHAVRALLALGPLARVLLEPAVACELVRVQDVQHREGGGAVRRGALQRHGTQTRSIILSFL